MIQTLLGKSSAAATASSTTKSAVRNASLKLRARPSETRGSANHGWLKTFHTFSFAGYQDSDFESYGPLRVINEDRVEPNEGFGTHPHQTFQIWSYIVAGELEHRDSMGNVEIMKRGDIQMTDAGTGIRHSEYNRHPSKQVHFLQIWALPNKRPGKPVYYTRHVTDAQKRAGLVQVVGPLGSDGVSQERESDGAAPVSADLHMFATLLGPGASAEHKFQPSAVSPSRKAYVHIVQTSGFNTKPALADGARVRLNSELELGEGDGAFVEGGKAGELLSLESIGEKEAEVLVFDLGDA